MTRAWHFLPENGRTRYSDEDVEVGETLTYDWTVELCASGLHASVDILDALTYAPGPVLCRVEVGGNVVRGDDKLAGTTRTCLSKRDVSRELRLFAVLCARRALARAGVRDRRSRRALVAAIRHLRGVATDVELSAAWAASWDAARDAARDAAVAARAAASAAARDAERDWQRATLLRLVGDLEDAQ
jgi:hypothetical protein